MVNHFTLKDNPLIANMPNKLFVENLVFSEKVEAYIVFVNLEKEARVLSKVGLLNPLSDTGFQM